MNRTIRICLAVLLVLGLTACTQAVSKAASMIDYGKYKMQYLNDPPKMVHRSTVV